MDQMTDLALRHQFLEQLARGRVDVERYVTGDTPSLDHLSHNGKVAVARVRRRPHIGLVDRHPAQFPHADNRIRAVGLGDERLERGKVDLIMPVIGRIRIGDQLNPILLPLMFPQKRTYLAI